LRLRKSFSECFLLGLGLEEKNEIRTTALVVIDRLECVFLRKHSSSISGSEVTKKRMILSVLSSPALVSGLMVVRAKNPVHSVSFPIPVFRNTSGLLILLGLDFSAMISPVVHIGAIAASFLFVVMMFNIQIAETHEEVLRYLPVSGIIGLILWWEMFFILDNETIPLLPTHRNTTSLRYTVYAGKVRSWTNLETLGNLLYTYYSVRFLVPSLILLVAMIGAIVLTMHRTTKVKRQDVFRRNAIDSRRTIMRRTTDQIDILLTRF